MINNYKAQRNVRGEAQDAVFVGGPVAIYVAEDELIYGDNVFPNGDFEGQQVGQAPVGWTNSGMDTFEISTDYATKGTNSLKLIVGNSNDKAFINFTTKVGQAYAFRFWRTITNLDEESTVSFQLRNTSDADIVTATNAYVSNPSTGAVEEVIYFTATETDTRFRVIEADTGNDAICYIDNIRCYEITDVIYKRMVTKDTIPTGATNSEALSSEKITADYDDNGTFDNDQGNWASYTAGSGSCTVSYSSGDNSLECDPSTSTDIEGAFLDADHISDFKSGHTYRVSVSLKGPSLGSKTDYHIAIGDVECDAFEITSSFATYEKNIVATGDGDLRIYNKNNNAGAFYIDSVSVKEVFGYDYYMPPQYRWGVVSSVYDQDTGAMKTTASPGDQAEVTVQGECNIVATSNVDVEENRVIVKINSSTAHPSDYVVSTGTLPNNIGTIVETNDSSKIAKAILWQGVEFSEHFSHKNSIQVNAECSETITKFRPVSLYLNSAGDLLCKHDDIPHQVPVGDTDWTSVSPGKWGVAELGGASGDVIPVTVAGKTHFNTTSSSTAGNQVKQMKADGTISFQTPGNNNHIPNALGTSMLTKAGASSIDLPMTLFSGTPISSINNFKRVVKVTAKASGAVTKYCPVSLFLDEYGDYKCKSDDIPNDSTGTGNGIWVDFRKWGIAQDTVADGEFVEIIVQGRTNVVNSKGGANKADLILKINASGSVTGGSAGTSGGYALNALGIVEAEADSNNGKIIIY